MCRLNPCRPLSFWALASRPTSQPFFRQVLHSDKFAAGFWILTIFYKIGCQVPDTWPTAIFYVDSATLGLYAVLSSFPLSVELLIVECFKSPGFLDITWLFRSKSRTTIAFAWYFGRRFVQLLPAEATLRLKTAWHGAKSRLEAMRIVVRVGKKWHMP